MARTRTVLSDHTTSRVAAFALLFSILFVALILGYSFQHPGGFSWRTLISDLYANLATELMSIAVTVFIIDALNQRRQARLEKERLIREMASSDNGIALRAARELGQQGNLTNGSLRSVWLDGANLEGAQLLSADLHGVSLRSAKLRGAELTGASLSRAALWKTDLRNATLVGADLGNANLKYANLEDARVTRDQLRRAYSLRGSVLPDGTVYDGRFQLDGDIREAILDGVNMDDATALSKWYSMPWDEFWRSMDLRNHRPEYDDWHLH